jgi:hypothetical protein
MNPKQLSSALAQFTGTEHYYRIHPKVALTDGAKFLADEAGAYWLMDAIGSHLCLLKSEEYFASCTLNVSDHSAKFLMDDGNGGILAQQDIPYTDFPLPSIKLYGVWADSYWVIMLPSEY